MWATLRNSLSSDHSAKRACGYFCTASITGSGLSYNQHPVSISEKTSYRKISWSLEAARFVFRIVRSLWNLTGTSAALPPMCLSNFKTIQQFKVPISWLRDFTKSDDKTSFRISRRDREGSNKAYQSHWCHIISHFTCPRISPYVEILTWPYRWTGNDDATFSTLISII